MPKNKPPKVAYAVFVGRNPGVYSTWYDSLIALKLSPVHYADLALGLRLRKKSKASLVQSSRVTPLRAEAAARQ